jgi:DNA-binding transcriptional MocR family regulator
VSDLPPPWPNLGLTEAPNALPPSTPPAEPDASLRLPPAVTLYERAVTLCGLSKSWALPGLRVGWVASRDVALIARVAALKDYTTICTAGPSEVGPAAGLAVHGRMLFSTACSCLHVHPLGTRRAWDHTKQETRSAATAARAPTHPTRRCSA